MNTDFCPHKVEYRKENCGPWKLEIIADCAQSAQEIANKVEKRQGERYTVRIKPFKVKVCNFDQWEKGEHIPLTAEQIKEMNIEKALSKLTPEEIEALEV